MFYWFLSYLYIIRVPLVETVAVVSDFRQLDNNLIELHETLIATDSHLPSVKKIDKCNLCVVFLEDLKLVINGTASPVVSQAKESRKINLSPGKL
ncbi:hypothetical protein LOAG_04820 [Loa loa]|uniref:Uncharacterized protein n=1 Tax=Loa loa TaxID=7209 RepID=A0A1S0U1C2_LOALO|nr:hypothetical protein LOAG_04820 [Loa loa]EFO23667.1 hypothetical protein LOAG_04820 [Loa loa]